MGHPAGSIGGGSLWRLWAALVRLPLLPAVRTCPPLPRAIHCSGHVCMVFERLGPSLYDFLRRNAYRPFPLAMVGWGTCLLGLSLLHLLWSLAKPMAAAGARLRQARFAAHARVCRPSRATGSCWRAQRCRAAAASQSQPLCPCLRHLVGRPRRLRGSCWRAWHSCTSCSWCTPT